MNIDLISHAVAKLQQYIEKTNYKGYDPYDGLSSPLFQLPILKNNKTIRFLSQQLIKRLPFNLRPLLMIRKGYNPVTLGLCIQAYANLIRVFPGDKKKYEPKIEFLIDELVKLIPSGYAGACWGYDFDWESRYSRIPSGQPTVVATGLVTNGLFHVYRVTGNKRAFELCHSATKFLLNDLNRIYDKENKNFCFSYSPFDHEVVFNASMKGARTLAQVYSQTKEEELKIAAQCTAAFVFNNQQDDGSWVYSKSAAGTWIDNYHTGYILDCLEEYMKCTGDTGIQQAIEKGFGFYEKNFITAENSPKFYDREQYPIDCTAGAQSLLTLTRFGKVERAGHIAEWMITNMQSAKGYFYFRKFRGYSIRTSFMRWSNAWMFLGLTEVWAAQKTQVN